VLRSSNRNLQPLVDAGIEFRKGKRLTIAELKTIKSRTILQDDGTLKQRYAVEDGDVHGYVSDQVWAARLKTWKELNKFKSFGEVAERSGITLTEIDQAARYGDHDDKCDEIDWAAIQTAIDDLTGRTVRRARAAKERERKAARTSTSRAQRKFRGILSELQAADFVVFPSDIGNEKDNLVTFDELDARVVRRDLRKLSAKYSEGIVDAAEIVKIADDVSDDMSSPAIEYWGDAARKQRTNTTSG
jgi:hypothetical protein